MAISPAEIRARQFSTVKRGGYDQREVESFRTAAADSLESALQESTAMEARARAAVARLQELSQKAPGPAVGQPAEEEEAEAAADSSAQEPAPSSPTKQRAIAVEESETISRTLLLAQRTADTTVAQAEQSSRDRIEAAAAEATQIVEDAKTDSRRAGESERVRVEGEVQALLARRDFLESDVDQLEQHLQAQRERITEVVVELGSITSRVPSGLAPMRRPQLSASDQSGEQGRPDTDEVANTDDDDDVDVSSLIDEAQDQDADDTQSESHSLLSPDDPR